MNVWSALKHLRVHEHVEGSREFNHGGSGGTSEEPGTVYLVQLLDCITIVSVCNGELMNNSFAFAMKNAMCSEASCLNQGHLQDFYCKLSSPMEELQRRALRDVGTPRRIRSGDSGKACRQGGTLSPSSRLAVFRNLEVWC